MTPEETVELFIKSLDAVGMPAVRAQSLEGVQTVVSRLVEDCHPVYCPRRTELERALDIPSDVTTDDFERAGVSVEEMPAGIAETGTLVTWSSGGAQVQTSLLPARHVALVASANIFGNLNEFFASFGGKLPSNITLITGPSRTADIEQILITGVHGPERVDVVVYDSFRGHQD